MANLSESDRRLINARIKELRKRGVPQDAAVLIQCLADDKNPPANLMGTKGFKPEKDIAVSLQDLEIPPRAGRGASQEKWAEFALTVADIEPQVVAALNRDEIIDLLEVRGIIDKDGLVEAEEEPEVEPEVATEVEPEETDESSYETAEATDQTPEEAADETVVESTQESASDDTADTEDE